MKNKRSFLSLISVILLLTIASCSRNGLSSSANKNIKREKAPIEKYLKENLPKCDFKKEIVKKDKYSSYVRYIYELEGESKTKEIDPKIVDALIKAFGSKVFTNQTPEKIVKLTIREPWKNDDEYIGDFIKYGIVERDDISDDFIEWNKWFEGIIETTTYKDLANTCEVVSFDGRYNNESIFTRDIAKIVYSTSIKEKSDYEHWAVAKGGDVTEADYENEKKKYFSFPNNYFDSKKSSFISELMNLRIRLDDSAPSFQINGPLNNYLRNMSYKDNLKMTYKITDNPSNFISYSMPIYYEGGKSCLPWQFEEFSDDFTKEKVLHARDFSNIDDIFEKCNYELAKKYVNFILENYKKYTSLFKLYNQNKTEDLFSVTRTDDESELKRVKSLANIFGKTMFDNYWFESWKDFYTEDTVNCYNKIIETELKKATADSFFDERYEIYSNTVEVLNTEIALNFLVDEDNIACFYPSEIYKNVRVKTPDGQTKIYRLLLAEIRYDKASGTSISFVNSKEFLED